MPRLMIVVASVRPGRIGLPIAEWVRSAVQEKGGFEIDFADLAEIGLPFMDEPNHPRLRQYTHDHTIRWSERVDAADAFIFVTPEYNHSFSPALKNALDYLSAEWWRKPVGFVSYGGVSAGSRGVNAIENVIVGLGLVKTGAAVEITFAGKQVQDGSFVSTERQDEILAGVMAELAVLAGALIPLR
ncbi:NADPH-dependent FMN reductase [Lacisediminihabitans profunda]|uniref:NAD(P)H-dependent oxidoreductase n=1 Tax=Lacisediminihabitans profunda TaxID=2594790 RepID=A0A5C8US03_9MICO|nr:NAD(P)H-dependent oxidoreductase [Lacisediminihabitans profunda]TXN31017.1 NAD(P)H-dependent oxidoreductase [Lacisediminihabitans profunda]